MSNHIGYLPIDLVTRAHCGLFENLDDTTSDELVDLLAEAYRRGYTDGYVRGVAEHAHRTEARKRRERAAESKESP